ncbi:Putative negative regulator of RcsB-dependent stress response [Vibrio xiamenensis]|uniref:Ancillary SecYEG translocon subunit n=1 Tax=Vibrio xiamenensis TaxID=861298 RepID=A0A1G7W5G4_9VIBR|nr:YfgM family protein [Vibrio xiamenensis]SDG67203.1 Putative negative regulator of RcsB-dependent stress response [Vibrio xiamenensis]
MELYDTEEQQVEQIKEWFKENGKPVVAGLVICLGGIFGWRFYQDSVIEAQEAASKAYTATMTSLQNQGADAQSAVQSFIDANKDTEYSVLAALQLAKVQVEAGQLDQAIEQLSGAKGATKDDALSTVINYRLARLHAEKQDYQVALDTLKSITDESWQGRVAELRGDILLRQGDKDAAYIAYTEAQQDKDASQALQMKLDDLAK